MRSDMGWRDPASWRWWWHYRVSGKAKGAIAVMGAVAFAIAGFLGAGRLAATRDATTFTTQRLVTVVRKARANARPEVVTTQTVIQRGETDVVTVRRDGRTVVRRAPGETVIVRGVAEPRVVMNARTDTVVRTETTNRVRTVTTPGTTETTPGTTETVTREVTQPPRTVTETNTEKVTVTEEVTVTEGVTVTETVTVPPGKP